MVWGLGSDVVGISVAKRLTTWAESMSTQERYVPSV